MSDKKQVQRQRFLLEDVLGLKDINSEPDYLDHLKRAGKDRCINGMYQPLFVKMFKYDE